MKWNHSAGLQSTRSFIMGLVNDAKTVIIIDHQDPLKTLFMYGTCVDSVLREN